MRYSNDENCLEKILSPFFSFAPKFLSWWKMRKYFFTSFTVSKYFSTTRIFCTKIRILNMEYFPQNCCSVVINTFSQELLQWNPFRCSIEWGIELGNKVYQSWSFQAIKYPAFDRAIPAELVFAMIQCFIGSSFEMFELFWWTRCKIFQSYPISARLQSANCLKNCSMPRAASRQILIGD